MVHNFPETRVCKGFPLRADIWETDITVKYSGDGNDEIVGGERGAITQLSKASLRRMCFVAQNTTAKFQMMTTLTYPKEFPTDGREVKRHFYKWLKWSKKHCEVDTYFWALEFQGRGAPHFHIFTPFSLLMRSKLACSREWYEIVGSGDEKHLKAGTRIEALRKQDSVGRYAAKYASKTYQKAVPPDYQNVGRFWGNSYNVKPVKLATKKLTGWGELVDILQGWEYIERIESRKPTAVLYNAGKWLRENFQDE